MKIVVIAGVLGAAGAAAASPYADALAKRDVAALKAQLPTDDARCALGAVYAAKKDLSRADLYLYKCDDATLTADIADDVHRALHDTTRALRDSDLSGIDVVTHPDGLPAEIDAMPGEKFTSGRTVWVPAGHHVVHVWLDGKPYENSVDSKVHSRGPVLFELAAPPPPVAKDHAVDFGQEAGPMDAPEQGAPPDVKHPKMKIGVLDAHASAGGDELADPLEQHAVARPWRFGARLGGGMFAQSEGATRLGPAVAALATMPLVDRVGIDLRADWTRRGSDGVDAIGLTIGPSITLARLTGFDLRAGAGLRADVRLESRTIDAMSSSAVNVHGAGWFEVPLQSTPLTFGLRYEHGLTSLVSGVRDEAVIAEIGWELR